MHATTKGRIPFKRKFGPNNMSRYSATDLFNNWSILCSKKRYMPSKYREYTMLRTVALCLVLFSALFTCSQARAEEHPEITRFCTWKANAARVIAMNRDVGLKEVDLIGHYLDQDGDYEEQKIVLDLIEKIYGPYEFVTNDTIFSQTRKTCARDFYIKPTNELAASKH